MESRIVPSSQSNQYSIQSFARAVSRSLTSNNNNNNNTTRPYYCSIVSACSACFALCLKESRLVTQEGHIILFAHKSNLCFRQLF